MFSWLVYGSEVRVPLSPVPITGTALLKGGRSLRARTHRAGVQQLQTATMMGTSHRLAPAVAYANTAVTNCNMMGTSHRLAPTSARDLAPGHGQALDFYDSTLRQFLASPWPADVALAIRVGNGRGYKEPDHVVCMIRGNVFGYIVEPTSFFQSWKRMSARVLIFS